MRFETALLPTRPPRVLLTILIHPSPQRATIGVGGQEYGFPDGHVGLLWVCRCGRGPKRPGGWLLLRLALQLEKDVLSVGPLFTQ